MLDRTVGKPEDQDQDNQLNQFVPDLNVVGKSSTLGQVCPYILICQLWTKWDNFKGDETLYPWSLNNPKLYDNDRLTMILMKKKRRMQDQLWKLVPNPVECSPCLAAW